MYHMCSWKQRHELREKSYWMAGASQMNLRQWDDSKQGQYTQYCLAYLFH